METTTVKVRKTTKNALQSLQNDRESYDEIIQRLIQKEKKKALKAELVEGYKSIGKDDLHVLAEWDSASAEVE